MCWGLSSRWIHSHQSHFEGFLKLLDYHGIRTKVHAFLDGRDTPQSAGGFMGQLRDTMESLESSTLATVMGRFYMIATALGPYQ